MKVTAELALECFLCAISFCYDWSEQHSRGQRPEQGWRFQAGCDGSAGTGDLVTVIDTAGQTIKSTVVAGTGPEWVAFSEDSAFVYVTNITSDNVTVIDTASATVTNTIAVGSAPIGIGVMGTVKVSTVAGGYVGDAPSALNAAIGGPFSSVYDSAGNLYTSDFFMNRIRKVTPAGAISTYSGTGICACRERRPSGRHLKSYPGIGVQTTPT